MTYKCVIISKRGGPEVLLTIEKEFRRLGKKEVLIKIQACGVGGTDIAMRYWNYPGVPKIPFVPGYEIVGIIEKVGQNVSMVHIGDRVGALTRYGGYAQYIYLRQEDLVKVPDSLDAGEAAAIILNYTSAYQMLKKVAKVTAGSHVLITGASGGVGSALLDLGRMEKLVLYGLASIQKHKPLLPYGAQLIDYKTWDYIEVIKGKEPEGLDFVFDAIGGEFIKQSYQILRKRGMLIEYGYSFKSISYFAKTVFDLFASIPKGIKAKTYGISINYKFNKRPILEDISKLFQLLEEGKIKPLIYKRMPILQATEANRMLENGEVIGNVVLVSENN